MDWRDHITADPEIISGKPAVTGTRIGVELVLDLFASGWTSEEILENYPSLTPDSLRAVLAFAAEVMREERFFSLLGAWAAYSEFPVG